MFTQLHTVRDFIRYTVSKLNETGAFFGHGSTNAYDEAVHLVLESLHLPIKQLEPYLEANLLDSEKQLLLKNIELRTINKIPVPYITHKAYLQNYEFYVDERVIIPRSFIAEIILNGGLEKWIQHPELVHNALDLCTGNGSLATIMADYYYDAEVTASDISEDAIEVAKINFAKNQVSQYINIVQSDLFDNFSNNYTGLFDLIVTNPPYVDDARMASLSEEYTHEPNIALFGGADGLVFVDNILQNAADFLSKHGVLVVEMGDNRQELEDHYPELPFVWLDTISGDGFVFLLTRADLDEYFGY